MSLPEWHRVLRVNLDGAFLCLREAARVLVEQGQGGSLVGVSSTSDFETVGAFLADPTLTFHTGDSMVVDGGYTIF